MKEQAGQTLIEVLVGLSAAVVVIAAITSAALTSLNNAQYSRDQNLATQYAQQGMELVRNMRDLDIASVSATFLPNDTYCLAKLCSALTPTNPSCWSGNLECGQNVDTYVRKIVVDHNSSSCNSGVSGNVQITSEVSWADGKCTDVTNPFCHHVDLSSCLSDFTVAPTP